MKSIPRHTECDPRSSVLLGILVSCLLGCSSSENPISPPARGPITVNDGSPAWSPDGQWVAFHRGGPANLPAQWGLYKIKSDGTEETMLLPSSQSPHIASIDWSDQDWLLVSTLSGSVYKIRPDGLNRTALYSGLAQRASWSPDGSQIVLRPDFALMLMDSMGQALRLLDPADSVFRGEQLMPDWGPNGKVLHLRWIASQNYPLIAEVDPVTLLVDVLDSGFATGWYSYPAYASDKAFLFVRYIDGQHPQLLRIDSVGTTARCLTCRDPLNEGGNEFSVHIPSGRVAYSNTRHGGISVMDADGSNERVLTHPGS